MKLFDFFRSNERAGGVNKRRARQAPSRFVRMQVECLESRSLLSLAPPTATVIAPTNYQANSYEDSAYLSGISASLNYLPSGPATSLPFNFNFSSPNQSSGGLILIRPLTGSQSEPLLAGNASGAGGIILGSTNSIFGLPQSAGNPVLNLGTSDNSNEARLVQDMLSSLRYVPFSFAASDEQSHAPTIVLSNSDSAPLSAGFTTPAVTGVTVRAVTGTAAADSTGVSVPASPAIFAAASNTLSAPAASDIAAPASTNLTPPASTGLTAPPSTSVTAPAFTTPSSPTSTGNTAPTSTSSDTSASSDASTTSNTSARPSPNSADGGMVTLLRQPIVAHSTFDAISIAAIDALLETPAKVDSVQGRFQAFEISVSNEASPPIAPPPASGAQINLPFRPADLQTPTAADPNFHSAWTPAHLPGAAIMPNLFVAWVPPISTPAMSTEENLSAEESAPLGDLPPEAVDKVFSSSPRLDLATAAILAALVGRALWPARPAVEVAEEGAKSEARPRSARLRLHRMVPGC